MAGRISPKIVSNGLVLCLDVANQRSYTDINSVWTDLTGNLNNGTFQNNPQFSNANLGSIAFDGINDSVNCGSGSSIQIVKDISIVAWINPANYTTFGSIAAKSYPGPGIESARPTPYDLFINKDTGLPHFATGNTSSFTTVIGTSQVTANTWQQVAVTMQSGSTNFTITHYLNDNVNGTGTSTSTPINQDYNLIIGNRNSAGAPFTGSIAMVAIYNRTLSADEIRQNYNALKVRFRLS